MTQPLTDKESTLFNTLSNSVAMSLSPEALKRLREEDIEGILMALIDAPGAAQFIFAIAMSRSQSRIEQAQQGASKQ